MSFCRLRTTACAFVLALLPFVADAAAPENATPPIEQFFQYPEFAGAVLSPDGRHIALKIGGSDLPMMLVVMDVETLKPKILFKSKSDVEQIRWVNDQRLVFTFSDRAVASGDRIIGPGLFAINIDGSEFRELVSRGATPVTKGRTANILRPNAFLLPYASGKQDSETIYVRHLKISADLDRTTELLRLNTLTGISRPVAGPNADTTDWLLDENGEPRLAQTVDADRVLVWYKDGGSDQWRKLYEYRLLSGNQILPVSFGPDGKLYALTRNHKDKLDLYTYDVRRNALDPKPVVAMEHYDFHGHLIFEGTNVVGVSYLADARTTLWLEPKFKALQAAVDTLLPATRNQISFGSRSQTPYFLVHAASDTEPGATYLYNSQTARLTPLGRALPAVDPSEMAHKKMVRYPARDGMTIPAYLTLPRQPAQGPLPMVVLVHGGPWLRGVEPDWSGASQFLASRGYAVLEPEFRGSTGFGNAHLIKGFRQWGLAMQNDLADGARWAIAEHIARPLNICIIGTSYGGYASLMGLINNPELFRCGASLAGPTSLDMLYMSRWSDASETIKTFGLPVLVGDRVRDAAQLKATSPVDNAARLRQPVLLAYGSEDRRVPLIHGTQMRDALAPTNQAVEWVEYEGEGHGLSLVKNRIDYWQRVEKLLDRTIGKDAKK